MVKPQKTVSCPYCGATIPRNAPSCPECGSDEQTGWSDQTYLDGIDLGEDHDYEKTLENEFSTKKHRRTCSLPQTITAVILLLLFVIAIIRALV